MGTRRHPVASSHWRSSIRKLRGRSLRFPRPFKSSHFASRFRLPPKMPHRRRKSSHPTSRTPSASLDPRLRCDLNTPGLRSSLFYTLISKLFPLLSISQYPQSISIHSLFVVIIIIYHLSLWYLSSAHHCIQFYSIWHYYYARLYERTLLASPSFATTHARDSSRRRSVISGALEKDSK